MWVGEACCCCRCWDGPDEVELFVDKDGEWRGFKEPRKGRQTMKRNGGKKKEKLT